MRSRTMDGARPVVGSSRARKRGPVIIALASASIWRSPPDRVLAFWPMRSRRAGYDSATSPTRRRISTGLDPRSATERLSRTLRSGKVLFSCGT